VQSISLQATLELLSEDSSIYLIAWNRTGCRSSTPKDRWLRAFKRIGSACITLVVGDQVKALPGVSMRDGSTRLFESGDIGIVDAVDHHRCYITWQNSGQRTSTSKLDWLKGYQCIGSVATTLHVGDQVMVLPGMELVMDNRVIFSPGDIGVVDVAEHGKYGFVWQRTGRRSSKRRDAWLQVFKPIRQHSV